MLAACKQAHGLTELSLWMCCWYWQYRAYSRLKVCMEQGIGTSTTLKATCIQHGALLLPDVDCV